MSISNSTEKPTPVDAAEAEVVSRLCRLDVIFDRLGQAHATLDLLYTTAADGDRKQEALEGLCEGTLTNGIHSAMLRIEEAMEAAKEEVRAAMRPESGSITASSTASEVSHG